MGDNTTLKKISDHLNVSISTVSRALKDHPDVSAETKKRVRELAEFLDYEPNAFAVNLRTRHRNLFAIIVPEIGNYFYHSFIQAIEEESRRMAYSVMILQSMNDAEIERQNLRLCRHNHVAGVFAAVCSGTTNNDAFVKLEASDTPIVFFDVVPPEQSFNKVCIADEEVGKMAGEKLAAANVRKVLCLLGKKEMNITQGRQSGLEKALMASSTEAEIFYINSQDEAFTVCLQQLKCGGIDAVFCMSDEVMCGAVKAIQQLELSIPSSVKVLAVSNGFLPSLFTPSISYVKTNGYDLGKMSFERMRDIRSGKSFVRELYLPCSFVAGGSL